MQPRKPPAPSSWEGLPQALRRCRRAYHAAEYAQAEAILLEAMPFAYHDPKLWAWLGRIRQRQGREDASRQAFRQARQLLAKRHDTPLASPALARLLWQQGEQAAAQRMLQKLGHHQGEGYRRRGGPSAKTTGSQTAIVPSSPPQEEDDDR